MAHLVTTKTGSQYLIDVEAQFWAKNREQWNRTWNLKIVDREAVAELPDDASVWEYIEDQERVELPVVGKAFYITGRDFWYVTTTVVSIEEVDKDYWSE